eukprot:scaffold46596_cov52-Phaeocystis_antarctica.AAC.2
MPLTGFTCILRNECVSSGQAQTTANDQTWCVAVPSGAAQVLRQSLPVYHRQTVSETRPALRPALDAVGS